MKAKLIRKDGTVIELEGTPDELGVFINEQKAVVLQKPKQDTLDLADWFKKLQEEHSKQPLAPWWVQPLDLPNPGLPYTLCVHEFPNPWMGLMPPSCTKCGYTSPYSPAVISRNTTLEYRA